MSTYYIRLPMPPMSPKHGRLLLHAVVGIPLLSWFGFSALLSGWLLTTSSKAGPVLWYGSSTVLFFGLAVFVIWVLLALPSSGGETGLWSLSEGKGPPPETPPIAGAPRPVPVRPTPRLLRSAAEPLPLDREKSA